MNKNKNKSIASIASIIFVLLITVTACTLFLFPSSAYAKDASGVCWDCFDWGNGFRECGMTYSGAVECTHASGYCQIWGMCIIVY